MEKLFSYGTLKSESIQLLVFGRTLEGHEDSLIGYKESKIELEEEGGTNVYPILSYTGIDLEVIKGIVFLITQEELNKADLYETRAYKREKVYLASKKQAWVYLKA